VVRDAGVVEPERVMLASRRRTSFDAPHVLMLVEVGTDDSTVDDPFHGLPAALALRDARITGDRIRSYLPSVVARRVGVDGPPWPTRRR